MSDKVIIEELYCRECPEKEVKRCLEQKVKYQNSINYILSFIENDDNKEHISELKKRIAYPTRCDVVLEKQLQRLKKENEELKENKQRLVRMYERFKYTKKANYQYKKQIPRYKQTLEEIRDSLNNSCWEFADIGIKVRILTKINEVLKNDSIN